VDYDEIGDIDGVPVHVPRDESYRICSVCGRDCMPDPTAVDDLGVRIAWVCTEHGVQSIVDPFEHLR